MKFKKDDLKKALEIVKPGLANKEIIEQTSSFAFVNGRVITYNEEVSISHPVKDLEINGAVHSENLYKFLTKVKESEIDISSTDSELTLKCGRASSGFALNPQIVLPLNEEVSEIGKWKTLPKDFLEALNFAIMSCSSDMTNPKLTCVHVCEKGFIEGSDGYRIAHYIIEELPVNTFLLPASSAKIVVRSIPVKIAEGNGWVHFKTAEGTIVSCRVFNDDYVDSSQYIKTPKKGNSISLPTTLNEVLDKAIIFAKREQMVDEDIEIELKEKAIIVRADSDISWFKESIPLKYSGEPISFNIMPNLLKDILKQTNECVLHEKILHFKSDNWIYVSSLK